MGGGQWLGEAMDCVWKMVVDVTPQIVHQGCDDELKM